MDYGVNGVARILRIVRIVIARESPKQSRIAGILKQCRSFAALLIIHTLYCIVFRLGT